MAQFSGMWTQRQQMQSLAAGAWPSNGVYCDLLVVAGGGSGSYSNYGPIGCGAGGAGGYFSRNVQLLIGAQYTIAVGAGGALPVSDNTSYQGTASSITGTNVSVSMTGGGGGGAGSSYNYSTMNGGSGGGGGSNVTAWNKGYGIYGQGYDGGNGGGYYASGSAGGGAGGAASGTTYGPGVANSITGSSVTYARGGKIAVEAGVANSGNGGNTDSVYGSSVKAGDSGIVIIRYADTFAAATTTGSPTVVVSGGYRIYTFTGAGTITL